MGTYLTMKTQLSSLDISFLVRELSDLAGARIDKAYQIGERDFKITLRADEKKELIITPAYICLSKFEHDVPRTASNLAMLLRKNLGGGIITSIKQHRFDRIVEIGIRDRGTLMIELFSRGNLIFLDTEGIIKIILESQEWKDRTLKPGLKYVYPPETPDIREMELPEFSRILAEKKEMVKIIAANLGLGATYANEVLERVGVDPDSLAEKESSGRVFLEVKKMLDEGIDAQIVEDECPVDAIPFPMRIYKGLRIIKRESFNEAVDEYFTRMRTEGKKSEATKDYSEELRRLERVIEKQKKTVEEMGRAVDEFKEMGDKVYSRYQEIDAVLKGIENAKKEGKNWVQYLGETGLQITDPAARKFDFDGVGVYVDKSVPENAALYYEKSKKAKSKMDGAEEALAQSKKELAQAREMKVKAEKKIPEGPQERHKPEWYEKFRWFVSSNGFLVIGGRDATTNEILIKKHMEPNDLVFHSSVHGAPFFIVKNPDVKEIPDSTKQEAAEAAASYSSAWGAGWGSADVYAVKPEQVSKTAQSGEYLSKGAFVIRGEREWFKGTPLKIALGFKVFDKYAIVIGGPEGAVASQAKHYVRVGVGNMKSGQVAKDAKAIILRQTNKEDGQKIKKVIIGEIQKWVPAGKGMIMK